MAKSGYRQHKFFNIFKNDKYIALLEMSLDGCIFECEEFPAKTALKMFLQCSDEKIMDNYLYFIRFMEVYCRFDEDMIDETKEKLNARKSQILGYESKYPEFYMYGWVRNQELDVLDLVLEEMKSKIHMVPDQFVKFMEDEITQLKSYILKVSAKLGEDKTNSEVLIS